MRLFPLLLCFSALFAFNTQADTETAFYDEYEVVDDRPNGATHDRPNGATF